MANFKPNPHSVHCVAPSVDAEDEAARRAPFHLAVRQLAVRLPDGRMLFEDLNEVFMSERVGLVGRNGSGKSVFAKTLVDLVLPDRGSVQRKVSVAFVPQDLRAAEDTTLAHIAGMAEIFDVLQRVEDGCIAPGDIEFLEGRWDMQARLAQALSEAGLDYLCPRTPTRFLSGGELTRVALVGGFLSGAEMLVLDEPTNHLDRAARAWLGDKVAQWRGGLVAVSHDRELLEHMHRIIEIRSGALHRYGGNYSFYRTQRNREAAAAQAALDHATIERKRRRRELQQQHDAYHHRSARNNRAAKSANMPKIVLGRLRQGAEAYAGREQVRMGEAKEALDTAVKMAAERAGDDEVVALMLPASTVPAGKRVIQVTDAIAPFPADARPLSLTLSGPFRMSIIGPNGCGKTTLLKMLAGSVPPLAGEWEIAVPFAWLDQHSAALLPPQISVLERLAQLETPLPEGVLRTHLALLGLREHHVGVDACTLSGGERLKGALACALWGGQPARLLILDEPTNHLDLDSVLALETALRSYPGALMVVSHDQGFLDALGLTHSLEYTEDGWTLRML